MTATSGRARVAGTAVAWRMAEVGRPRRAVADELVARLASAAHPAAEAIEVSRRCERCGSTEHGRPVVIGARVQASVSYAGDLVVVAVADACHVIAVGVDAEARRGREALRGVIAPGRRATLRNWTRVEAVLKADGRGLAVDPGRVRITRSPRGVVGEVVARRVDDATGTAAIRPRLHRVRGPRGYVISLAVASV